MKRAVVVAVLALAAGAGWRSRQDPPAFTGMEDPREVWAAFKDRTWFDDVDWFFGDVPIDDSMQPFGADLYARYCVNCHGEKGEGHGSLSDMLIPPPRNFTRGIFKGRSSPPEMPPTAQDLVRSLVHGIPLSGMLSHSFITSQEQFALIAHVRELSKRVEMIGGKAETLDPFKRGYGKPFRSGNFHRELGMPLPTAETLARGKALFDSQCAVCHGEKGDGRGPQADTLVDTLDEERPSLPRDFTQGIFSGGPNVRHLYLRISAGVPGTPMPSFLDALSVDDRWALAHYVISLIRRKEKLPLPHSERLLAKRVDKVPEDPDAKEWVDVRTLQLPPEALGRERIPIQPFYVLPLYFQQLRHNPKRPAFTPAEWMALHDDRNIALLVEWEDATADPDDRIEVQLPKTAGTTFPMYGSRDDPVNLWRWVSGKLTDVVELDGTGPMDAPMLQPAESQDVKAVGKRHGNKWSVVFVRPLAGVAAGDPVFKVGQEVPILFLMRDASDEWPESTRPVSIPPDADPEERQELQKREEARQKREAEIRAKYKDLPRMFTTWHTIMLVNDPLK